MKTKNIRQDIFIFLLNFFWGIAQIIRKRQLRKARLRLARKYGREFLDNTWLDNRILLKGEMTGLMRKSLTVCTYSTNDLLKAIRVFKEGLDSKKIVSNT